MVLLQKIPIAKLTKIAFFKALWIHTRFAIGSNARLHAYVSSNSIHTGFVMQAWAHEYYMCTLVLSRVCVTRASQRVGIQQRYTHRGVCAQAH